MRSETSRKFLVPGLILTLMSLLLIGKPDLLHKILNQKRNNHKEFVLPVNKLAENLSVNSCSEELLKSVYDNPANFNVAKSGLNVFKARLNKEYKSASKNFSALANQVLLKESQATSNNKVCIFPLRVSAPESLADNAVKTDIIEISLGRQSLFCSKGKAYLSDYSGFYSVAKVLDSNAKELKKKKTVKVLQNRLKDLRQRKSEISANRKAQTRKIDQEINRLILSVNYAKFLSKETLPLVNFFDSVCGQLASIATAPPLPDYSDGGSATASPTKVPAITPSVRSPQATVVPTRSPIAAVPSDFRTGDIIELIKLTNVREAGRLTGTLKGQQQIGTRGTIIAGPLRADNITWWNVDFDSGPDGWCGEDNYKLYQESDENPADCSDGQTQSRVMYQKASVTSGENCISETQIGTCLDGVYTNWTGTYTHSTCHAESLNYCASGSAKVISQFGITWTFDKAYKCGQFANGDYWVEGSSVTIKDISPKDNNPDDLFCSKYKKSDGVTTCIEWSPLEMHGTMINPILGNENGWDSRIKYGKYSNTLNAAKKLPNLSVPAGSSVVSIESQIPNATKDNPQMQTAAVLTVLASAPAEGSFRPPLLGTDKTVKWKKSQLNYSILRKLTPVAGAPKLSNAERWFEKPWIEKETGWTGRYMHPNLNYPYMDKGTVGTYGREIAYTAEAGLLSLQLNYSDAQKERLFIRLVQAGLDVYGAARLGGYWGDGGGHNQGRKMVMLLAGKALGDSQILNFADGKKSPIFQEDYQTFYVSQADIDTNSIRRGVNKKPTENYLITDIGMPEWGIEHRFQPWFDNKRWDAPYRTVAGSASFGAMVTAVLMGLQAEWNHPVFFDYFQNRFWPIEGPQARNTQNEIQTFTANMYKVHVLKQP